jgi:GNAT superfamily N-acetyltransferase
MSIRRATRADIEAIGRLIVGLAEYEHLAHEVVWTIEQLEESLFGPEAVAKVELAVDDQGAQLDQGSAADRNSTIVGMALWYPTYSTFLGQSGIWLEDLFVLPEARGGGFGLALLNHLRSLTAGRVEWNVLDWNEPSINFYQALGAQPVDGWTRYRWLSLQTP